jgi:hypothetical protein
VPLHPDHPPRRVVALDAFDGAVVGPYADAHCRAESVDRLVVDGVHAE